MSNKGVKHLQVPQTKPNNKNMCVLLVYRINSPVHCAGLILVFPYFCLISPAHHRTCQCDFRFDLFFSFSFVLVFIVFRFDCIFLVFWLFFSFYFRFSLQYFFVSVLVLVTLSYSCIIIIIIRSESYLSL